MTTKKKNILFIFSDQHKRDVMGCYGNEVVKTPNIDSLANEGVRFDNAYTTCPLCVPARASQATGRYVHQIEAHDNASPYTGGYKSWGHRFEEEGFKVTTIGKLHFRNETDDTGFNDQRIPLHCRDGIGDLYGILRDKNAKKKSLGDDSRNAGEGKSKYIDYDSEVARLAKEYLLTEAKESEEPFVLYVGFVTPHFPLQVPKKYLDLYDLEDVPLPHNYSLKERSKHKAWQDVRDYMVTNDELDEKQLREAVRAYYGLCSFMDEQVGIVLKALKESGLEDDTTIIYSTDHGEMLGDHGMWLKNCLLEGAAAIPLIIKDNSFENKGRTIKTNVSLIDTYPTLLEAAGIELTQEDKNLPAKSLMPLVKGEEAEHNRLIFSEFSGSGSITSGFMVKDDYYKYIHYVGYEPQLFDINIDPTEKNNIADEQPDLVLSYEKKLRDIVNPELINFKVKEHQEKIIDLHGGREKILNMNNYIVASPPPKVGNKPNILFILTDDQGEWALGCSGNKEIITPNIDKLAEQGVRLNNFFCTSPVCSPARASILTGKIPSQHGVQDFVKGGNTGKDRIEYLEEHRGYTDYLKDAGYECGLSGKWHLGASDKKQKSFSHWFATKGGKGHYFNTPVFVDGEFKKQDGYLTDVLTDDAISFIEQCVKEDKPFYSSIHYTAPHRPWTDGEHPKELLDLYEDCKFETCPQDYNAEDAICQFEYDDKMESVKGYFASVTGVDRNVGKLIDTLERLGVLENTLIIYTSDNGFNCGHHGIWGKGNGTFSLNMYDTSVKVPFIAYHKGKIESGLVSDAMLSQYDIMPTILDYVGIENNEKEHLPGCSFLDVLKGNESKVHDRVVVFDEYGPVRMIRTKEYKYVHRYPYGPHELYDLLNDKDESKNLYGKTEYEPVAESLREQMTDWFREYVNPDIDGVYSPVKGNGQLTKPGVFSNGKIAFDQNRQYDYHPIPKVFRKEREQNEKR